MTEKANNAASRDALMTALYDAMLEPEKYDALLKAWDDFFVDASIADDQEQFSPVLKHFETAARAFEAQEASRDQTAAARLAAMSCPACIVSSTGRVTAINSFAGTNLGLSVGADIFSLDFDAPAETALLRSLKFNSEPTSALLRCHPSASTAPEFLLVDPAHDFGDDGALLVRSVRKVWSEELDTVLADAFRLTPAERELLTALFEGETVSAYADRTGRRQTTVRSQLSALLAKSGARGQTDLLRLATSVAGMLGERAMVPVSLRLGRTGKQWSEVHALSGGITLETVSSGAPDGVPLLFCQTSTTPVFPRSVVEALAQHGIRLIGLVKSGTGHTKKMPTSLGPEAWASIWLELADRLGLERFGVGGQCSGGPYALSLAAAAKERCTGCLLVDVGAPLRTVAMIDAMPPSPRRHHLASRFCPKVTIPPIAYMAADMRRAEGAARAVKYFYTDAPIDEAAAAANQALFDVTVANLTYAFDNIPQLVKDISIWSKDTTAYYTAAEEVCDLTFFHGAENLMMRADALQEFCLERPSRRAWIEPGVGQLALWAKPGAFAAAAQAAMQTN